jgi:hypothetical protein
MKQKIIWAILLSALALRADMALSQREEACGDKIYEDHNQVDYKPLKLATIQGRGVVEIQNKVIKPNETVPGACLSLFTLDHKLVMSATADSKGEFRFAGVAPGRYRLIAHAQGFCTANIPIQVVNASSRSKLQANEILVHYRLTGIDKCSWGELGRRSENAISNGDSASLRQTTAAAPMLFR